MLSFPHIYFLLLFSFFDLQFTYRVAFLWEFDLMFLGICFSPPKKNIMSCPFWKILEPFQKRWKHSSFQPSILRGWEICLSFQGWIFWDTLTPETSNPKLLRSWQLLDVYRVGNPSEFNLFFGGRFFGLKKNAMRWWVFEMFHMLFLLSNCERGLFLFHTLARWKELLCLK